MNKTIEDFYKTTNNKKKALPNEEKETNNVKGKKVI